MKRRFTIGLLLCVVLYATGPGFGVQRDASERPRYAENEILVQLRTGVEMPDASAMDDLLLPRGVPARAESLLPLDPTDGLLVVRFEGMTVNEAIRVAEGDPRVEFAEPNYLVYPADRMPNDPFFGQQWGLMNQGQIGGGTPGADINGPGAWDINTGNENVIVAVTDTGIQIEHPDLAPNVWTNPREIPGNGIDDDGNGFIDDINGFNFFSSTGVVFESTIDDRHGTHVTGIIGAAGNNDLGVAGVCWDVQIMALKFIGPQSGTIAGAVRAINYARMQKEAGENVRVINASWSGSDESKSLRKAIRKAGKAGILFVCAAGNGGADFRGDDLDVTPDFPAAWGSELPTLISVAALDMSDNLAGFSNFGHRSVTLGAPGVSILSTLPPNGLGFLNGTSMATPHVSGVAALLWSHEPTLTPEQVRERLISTADPLLSLASKSIAAGRVNAFNALTGTVPIPDPGIANALAKKKALIITGLGFFQDNTIIEVNGVPAGGKIKYVKATMLPNGSLTEIKLKLGKPGMEATFPLEQEVLITVFNPSTGERSEPFPFTRR